MLFSVMLFSKTLLYAQNLDNLQFDQYTTEHYVMEKGLSQNSIFSIYQDKIGFMWFGTWDGLNRYDGYSFVPFSATHKGIEQEVGRNESINYIVDDEEGNIWIATEAGLIKFVRKTQKYYVFSFVLDKENVLSSNSLSCLIFDNEGYLWIGTDNGLNKFDTKTNENTVFKRDFSNPNAIASNVINDIQLDDDGDLWIATQMGLSHFILEENKFENIYKTRGLLSDSINCIEVIGSHKLWVGTARGLNYIDYSKNKILEFSFEGEKVFHNKNITAIYYDKKGYLWVGTLKNALYLYDLRKKELHHYQNIPGNKRSLSSNEITEIFQDKSGDVWIGTSVGLNRVDYNKSKFRHYSTSYPYGEDYISNDMVWAIEEIFPNEFWVGTNNGINIFNKNQQNVSVMNVENSFMTSNNIRSIYKDSKGNIWIGSFDSGLIKYNTNNGSFELINNMSTPAISHNTVWNVLEDSRGMIWIATDDGLNRYNPKTNQTRVFFHDPKVRGTIPGNKILAIYEDRQNVLWFAIFGGLARYDRRTESFITYKSDPSNTKTLSSNRIFSIYEDSKGMLWITTMGGGLNKFDRNIGEFTRYTESNGLSNNVVYNVKEDKFNFLWLTTNRGVSRFDPITHSFTNYDIKDGLQGYEYNLGAFKVLSTGEFIIGGTNGINVFIPEKVSGTKSNPSLAITAFNLYNKKVKDYIPNGDTIYLHHDENFFSFEFAALDFSNSYRNKYAYRLESVDPQWNITDARGRKAEYTNINPGTYVFIVKATNSDGEWSNESVRITIIIKPPWYKTLVFRISLMLLLLVSMWQLIQVRVKRERKKHQEKEKRLEIENQVHELEQQALRLQMNPHFIFNSLNSIQSFVIENDTDKAINYLAKFSQLMRLILSSSRETYVPLEDEIKSLSYYLEIERLRFNSKFDYKIDVDSAIDKEFTEAPPMIIQPYVENAIIHGMINKDTKGFLSISFKIVGNVLRCVVEDNGIGREKAMELKKTSGLRKKSRGMLITQQRLEILNKQTKNSLYVKVEDLYDKNNKATGTRVIIHMPFIED